MLGLVKRFTLDEVIEKNNRREKVLFDRHSDFEEKNRALEKKSKALNEALLEKINVIESLHDKLKEIQEIDYELGCNLFDVYHKRKKTTPSRPAVPSGDLKIMSQHIEDFKNKVLQINHNNPENPVRYSKMQEGLIFARNTAVCNIAGAGSGKSTALILRVIFFHFHLNIPIEQITVCTFTTESRKDFIAKLRLRFFQWGGKELSKKKAESIVRTFHSLAFEVHQKLGSSTEALLFDKEKDRPSIDDPDGSNIPNLMEVRASNSQTIGLQEQLQFGLYSSLFRKDKSFQSGVMQLYRSFLSKRLTYKAMKDPKRYDGTKEQVLSDKSFELWLQYNSGYTSFQEFYRPGSAEIGDVNLNYHLLLPASGIRVFFSRPYTDFIPSKLNWEITKRHNHCAAYAGLDYVVVFSAKEVNVLITVEKALSGIDKNDMIAPDFSYICQGDIGSLFGGKGNSIVNQFAKLIDFSYSMGVPLCNIQFSKAEKHFKILLMDDRIFMQLAIQFHQAWNCLLTERGLVTFDQIFHRFGGVEAGKSQLSLDKLQHLMIDEFQDISPLMISFINTQKQILTASTYDESSITCIGDDYQSIYGWRGSCSSFIVNFDECFSIPHVPDTQLLTENYRSAKQVLDTASLVTKRFRLKSSNKGYMAKAGLDSHPEVQCCFYPPLTKEGNGRQYEDVDFEKVEQVLRDAIFRFNPTPEKPIYILKTKNKILDSELALGIIKLIRDTKMNGKAVIKSLTIHSSKGLEASCVILLGDILKPEKHPIREGIYRLAGRPHSYNAMQTDEALRVAYVGITRAKIAMHWFFSSTDESRNVMAGALK